MPLSQMTANVHVPLSTGRDTVTIEESMEQKKLEVQGASVGGDNYAEMMQFGFSDISGEAII